MNFYRFEEELLPKVSLALL